MHLTVHSFNLVFWIFSHFSLLSAVCGPELRTISNTFYIVIHNIFVLTSSDNSQAIESRTVLHVVYENKSKKKGQKREEEKMNRIISIVSHNKAHKDIIVSS